MGDPHEFPPITWGESASAQLVIEWLTSPEAHEVAAGALSWHVDSPIRSRSAARNVLNALHTHLTQEAG